MNYGELKAKIAARLARTDLAAVIPDFISLGESRIYYGFKDPEIEVKPLRLRAMLAVADASTFNPAALPTDFLALERLTVPGIVEPLQYATPAEFAVLAAQSYQPQHYTFQNGGMSIQGGTPAEFTISYYKKYGALSADGDTNWLLTNHPNVYFYSALIEAYQHLKNETRVIGAVRMFASAANAATASDEAERHSGSVLCIPVGNAV